MQVSDLPYQLPDERGHFGPYGGIFVAETLVHALDELKAVYEQCRNDPQPKRQWDVGARADRWLRRRSDLGHSPSALTFPVGCCYRRVAGSGRGWTPYGPRDTALARVSFERPAGRLTDPCET